MVLIHNSSTVKLGKHQRRVDPRTLILAKYVSPDLIAQKPDAVAYESGIINWGMMANDRYGDCTAAGAGHLVRLWNELNGRSVIVPDAEVLALYELVTGQEGAAFDPITGDNDNGCNEIDVLNAFRQTGLGVHKLHSYSQINPKRMDLLRAAIWLFGSVYVGVQLPNSAQNQRVWDVTDPSLAGDAAPGSWGGHCIILTGYDAAGFNAVTWGANKRLTNAWWLAYGEEAYAPLSEEWIGNNQLSPSAFNLVQLESDLAAVT